MTSFFNFPKSGSLIKLLVWGSFHQRTVSVRLPPFAFKKSQNALPEFLIFHSFFCMNILHNGIEDYVKFVQQPITERTLKMANRERKNELKIYLSDEQYIPEQKVKASGMRDKSSFLRHQILYGYVYDIDYSELREYNTALGKIGSNLNQIAKRMNATGNVYAADVKEVKELMKKVWDTQKATLSKQPYMKQ